MPSRCCLQREGHFNTALRPPHFYVNRSLFSGQIKLTLKIKRALLGGRRWLRAIPVECCRANPVALVFKRESRQLGARQVEYFSVWLDGVSIPAITADAAFAYLLVESKQG